MAGEVPGGLSGGRRPALLLGHPACLGHDPREGIPDHPDPLASCRLEAASFGQMAARVRELGRSLGAPVGAVLEGGYSPPALAESVAATMTALRGEAEPGA